MKNISTIIFLSELIKKFSKLIKKKNNINDKRIIRRYLKNILDCNLSQTDLKYCKKIFFIKKSHINKFNIIDQLKTICKKNFEIIPISGDNPKEFEILKLKEKLNLSHSIFLFNMCNNFPFDCLNNISKNTNKNNFRESYIFLTKSLLDSNYFAKIKNKKIIDIVKKIQKKELCVLSNIFYRDANYFFSLFNNNSNKVEIIRLILNNKKNYKFIILKKFYNLCDLESVNFFRKRVNLKFGNKKIAISSDHSGYDLKQEAKKIMKKLKIGFLDVGSKSKNFSSNYSLYIDKLALLIRNKKVDYGISFCRTGQGVNISANKYKDIYSAYVFNEYTAKYAIEHNCANHFAIPSQYVDNYMLFKIIKKIKESTFDGGRHYHRVNYLV